MITDPIVAEAIARALGDALRRAREALGLSRAAFVRKLPSGIGERTLLAYEHGIRQLTIVRFIELCEGLGVSSADLLAHALQRAELHISHLRLRVDLHKVLGERNMRFRPLVQWARNRLNHTPNGIIEVSPDAVLELAAVVGHPREELTLYLCKFTPDPDPDVAAA